MARLRITKKEKQALAAKGLKKCGCCREDKPFEEFNKDKKNLDGLCSYCRPCQRDKNHTKAGKDSRKKYRATEGSKEARIRYRTSDKGQATAKKWRASEVGKATIKKYYASEKGKAALKKKEANRRALKLNAPSDDWTHPEVFNSANWQCFYCGIDVVQPNRAEKGYQPNEAHADHFIPLSEGGTNERKNIVCSCGQCNLSKGSKNPFDFIRDNINQ